MTKKAIFTIAFFFMLFLCKIIKKENTIKTAIGLYSNDVFISNLKSAAKARVTPQVGQGKPVRIFMGQYMSVSVIIKAYIKMQK